ncbi:uncharacterized protein RHO25_007646 [Cercospora beticola]|uniref:Uncharacterized protein n=1 Tax=Cercospora beticola TaxID=122368 RepID=A0ABZ0NU13_CERBT|nr:hypothetical protein RHO25_007646 [Cercospora beticola]
MQNLVRFLETIPSNKGTSRLAEAYRFVHSLMEAPDPWQAVAAAYKDEERPVTRDEVYRAFGGNVVRLRNHFDDRLAGWRWDSVIVEMLKSQEWHERIRLELKEKKEKKTEDDGHDDMNGHRD